MKLHLPKQLFTALLAAITLAAPATLSLGSTAWGADTYWSETSGEKVLENDATIIAEDDKVIVGTLNTETGEVSYQNLKINGKNSWSGHESGHFFTVLGELDASGGDLGLESGARMIIAGGSVTAKTMTLGHNQAGTGTYHGHIEMSSGSLTTGTIKLNQNHANTILITGGTLEFTSETAINRNSNTNTTITIGGTGDNAPILKAGSVNWTLDGAGLTTTPTIGNVTIGADNTRMITISNANLTGSIVNNATAEGAGLTLSGDFSVEYTKNGAAENGYNVQLEINLDYFGGSGNYIFADGLTFNGVAFTQFSKEGSTYTYSGDRIDTVYHVVSETVKIGENNVAQSASASHTGFVVYGDATLDINGKRANNQVITLQDRAILTNSGNDVDDGEIGINKQQISEVNLQGNAQLTNTGQMGIISNGWAAAVFNLGGNTLTKTGSGMFSVANASVSAGTLDIQAGEVVLASQANNHNAVLTVDSNLKVKLGEGTKLTLAGTHTTLLNADFLLNTTGTGTVSVQRDINVGSTGGTSTFAGNISVKSGTLYLGNSAEGTSEMEEIDFSLASLDMDGGNFRYFGGNSTIGTLNVNSTPASFQVYATNNNATQGTLTFNQVNVASDQALNMTSKWAVNVAIGALTGAGDLSIAVGTTSNTANTVYSINSVTSGFGTIANAGTLNLGAAGQTVTLGHKVVNTGSITLNGTLVIENLDADHFDVADGTFYSSATNQTADTQTLSGYAGAPKYQIISGTVTQGANFSYNGTYEFDAEKGLLVAGSNADTTRFYVNENIKWGVAGSEGDNFTRTVYTDRTASIYVVGADKTLDLNFGNTDDTHGWNEKSFELHAGAILANSGAAGNTAWQQLYRIDLKGDAKIDASGNAYGFLASNYNESILNLNDYTLEKTGNAAFRMINTSINAGTIKITGGAVQIGAYQAGDKDVTATEVDFVLNGGNLTFYNNANALTAKSISGSGNINSLTSKTGELTLVGNSGTHTITGDIGLNKLNLNGSKNYTLNGSMAIGDQLNVSNGKLELTTGSTAFNTTTLSGGTLQVTSGSMTQGSTFSQTGGILQINGGTVTFVGQFNGTNGTTNLMGGNIFFNNTTATNVVKNLDVAGSNASTAQVTLAENVKLQVDGSMWLGNTAAIKLAKDAELKKANMAIIGTGNNSSVTRLSSGDDNTFAHNSDDHEVTNARVEMTKTEAAELKLKLTGTDVTNAGSGTLSVLNSANTISNLAAVNGNVKLSASMDVDSISAKKGMTVTVTNDSTIAMGSRAVSIGIGANGADASMTAKSNNALARLQEDASFTIEDMTLVNTTLTAASVNTQVNLKNVSGNATLKTGTFALQVSANAPDNVGMSYAVTGTPSLTLASATEGDTKLVIAADPTADVSGAYGTYTLTFNLNLNLDSSISTPATGNAWKELVGFKGWLGTMLVNQEATYTYLPADEVEVAQVDAGTSTPTVSYSYTEGSGGNVGTLAIVITGLNVPEPTTSTLSLLALAALAARRRRND